MRSIELANGIHLAYDISGEAGQPVVLPILGITDNITDWPGSLRDPLTAAGYRVLRFELRDSGHSRKFDEAGVPDLPAAFALREKGDLPQAPYTLHDVVQDTRLLMDALGVGTAHVVGYSYGAAVAQLLALRYPDRVRSLVCLQGSNYAPALPARTPEVSAAMAAACRTYDTQQACIAAMAGLRLATNGPSHAMSEQEAFDSAAESVARGYHPEGTARIVLSRLATPPFHDSTRNITAPALVLHGSDDPIFPIEHGADMADRLPNAELSVLEGAGHNHPNSLKPLIMAEILRFLEQQPGSPDGASGTTD